MVSSGSQDARTTPEPAPRTSAKDAGALRELARRLRPREDELARRLISAYRAEIPQYAQVTDSFVLADMTAVSLGGLRSWLDFLEQEGPADVALLQPVLESIRRRAVQGVGPGGAAARVPDRRSGRLAGDASSSPVECADLIGPLSTRKLEFTDRMTTAVERAYAAEALRSTDGPELSRSALFEAILDDLGRDQHQHAVRLAAPHCIVVVEVPPDAPGVSLDDLAAALVREARASYWTTRLRSVIAACPVDSAGSRDALLRRLSRFTNAPKPLAVSLGAIAEGPEEIRLSYHEALDAAAGRLTAGPPPARAARPGGCTTARNSSRWPRSSRIPNAPAVSRAAICTRWGDWPSEAGCCRRCPRIWGVRAS